MTGRGRTLFGKNSDRPPSEVQVVEPYPRRSARGRLRTQYLEIDDAGAAAMLGSRPEWLWGFEHGVNEHRVAIGNEAVHSVDAPGDAALIGMDLVRLGLERARSADEAVDVMAALLERHGQGGVCNQVNGISYCSSFLIADPTQSWTLETSGTTWAAKRTTDGAAISNRITLRDDWTRASHDVPAGADFDRWRDPRADTDYADVRLQASLACVARGPSVTPRDLARHLRDHGGAPPGERISVCMHVRGIANSTASMIAELPEDPAEPMRAWVALGNPCVSVYVPVFPPGGVASELGDAAMWHRFAELRDRVEADPEELDEIRSVLDPLEAELWDEADGITSSDAREVFVSRAWQRRADALERVSVPR